MEWNKVKKVCDGSKSYRMPHGLGTAWLIKAPLISSERKLRPMQRFTYQKRERGQQNN